MTSFNVLDEGWIPVETMEGQRELLGIRKTLEHAHTIRAIRDASPLVEYGLYRFLQVFLMDALRPADSLELEDILDVGKFDMNAVEEYIAVCEGEGVSFDLFDEKRPFLQVPYNEKWDAKVEMKSVHELDYTIPHGNNHVHFDHREESQFAMELPEAARMLPTALLFCTAGAQKYPSGVNGAPPYYAVIDGDNLFETLCYTLIPVDEINIPFDDPPVLWRYQEPIEPKKKVTETSELLGMLFPTRRIRLIPEEGSGMIQSVYLSQGMNYISKDTWTDPSVTYRYMDSGRAPLRPKREKAVWRNFNDVIDVQNQHAPEILWLYRKVSTSEIVRLTLYGVETSNASYLQVMRHTLQFPAKLAERDGYVRWMQNMIEAAERLARSLKKALDNPKVLPAHIAVSAVQRYYDECGSSFWRFCNDLPDDEKEIELSYQEWISEIAGHARKSYQRALAGIKLDAKKLVSISKSEYVLINEIAKVRGGRK